MNAYMPLDHFTYIGFAASNFEDFKMVHSILNINKLFSIEEDTDIFTRQTFNKPLDYIKLKKCTADAFLNEFDFDAEENCITWLDYESPKQINDQLREFQKLLNNSKPYDVIKITVNANPDSLGLLGKKEKRDLDLTNRLTRLKERLGVFFEENTDPNCLTLKAYPAVLIKAIKYAADEATYENDLVYNIVTSFAYVDLRHQMLTVTGIILDKESDFLTQSLELQNWPYYFPNRGIMNIDLPDLTLKERLFINSMLPSTSNHILSELGYENIRNFKEYIDSYVTYYRYFPNFSKVLY
jgi:hypothetical protein